MNKNLFISFDEYQKMPPNKVPYTYIISNGKQYLYYFGSRHSYDPKDLEFKEIKDFFNEFLNKTEGRDRIVLVEGGNWPVMQNEERAIIECSEMGFVAFLASQSGIFRTSPEPKMKLLYSELEKHFSRDEIVYYYFARACWQWGRMAEKNSFESYIDSCFEMDKYHSGWNDFDFSLEHMKAIHKQFFGKNFDINDSNFFRNVIDPTKNDTNINKISRFEDEGFRDLHIIGEIEKYWNEGKNVFIVYGSSHAVIQEPVLRTLA